MTFEGARRIGSGKRVAKIGGNMVLYIMFVNLFYIKANMILTTGDAGDTKALSVMYNKSLVDN